jgi:hypothetical protein
MIRVQPADVVARVEQALMLMERMGWGIDKAAKFVKTDRRSVYRYLALKGIKWKKKGKLNQVFLIQPASAKKIPFLHEMSKGLSASKAARKLKTTVRNMKKVKEGGKPIISKKGRRWVANFMPVYRHRLVVYGTMSGFTGKTLGRNKTAPHKVDSIQDDSLDKDYADIWWQIDFDNFRSTLDTLQVGECHAPQIFEMLKEKLETPLMSNQALVTSFQTDPRINVDMVATGRGSTPATIQVSALENLFGMYNLQFDNDYQWGVDDSMGLEPIALVPTSKLSPTTYFQPQGKFQVIVLRKGRIDYYPPNPLNLHYRFTVGEEDDCRQLASYQPL